MSGQLQNFIVALVIGGVAAAFGALLILWMRSRLFGRAQAVAETLKKGGAQVLGVHPAKDLGRPAQVNFELDGYKARFQVRQYGRDYILQTIRLDVGIFPAILVKLMKLCRLEASDTSLLKSSGA